jgi:hypothetical protein
MVEKDHESLQSSMSVVLDLVGVKVVRDLDVPASLLLDKIGM